jgi:peptide/nickel transport system permease protein
VLLINEDDGKKKMVLNFLNKESHFYKSFKKIVKNKGSMIGLIIFLTMVIVSAFAPFLAPYNPYTIHWGEILVPPGLKFRLGTDHLGRDVLSRLIWGTTTSLQVGILSLIIRTIIAVIIGSVSGYFGGKIDSILMRFTDIILTIPYFFLLILVVSVFHVKGLTPIILTIGLTSWGGLARMIRSSFLSLKEAPYIEAAWSMRASNLRIIFKHILPNTMAPIIVSSTFGLTSAILSVAGLSYLGLADTAIISWGGMCADGQNYLLYGWWVSTFSGLIITITVIGVNMLGDGLRDALDVRI